MRRRPLLAAWAVAGSLMASGAPGATADYRAIYERYRGHVVAITYTLRPQEKPRGGQGRRVEEAICGVILDGSGLIVTSADPFPEPGGDPRVTLAPVEFEVHGPHGITRRAEAVGLDRDLNLAWLRLVNAAPETPPIPFGENALNVGDEVIVLGVMAKKYAYEPVFYTGHVNAVLQSPRLMYSLDLHVQDLSIGGLVLAADGRPIGIIGEDVLDEMPGADRMPANILSIFGSFTQGRRVGYPMVFPWRLFSAQTSSPPPIAAAEKRSWLGIVMQALNTDLIDYWKLNEKGGIIVSSVVDSSPAERAGLHPSDILIALDGEPITVVKDEELSEFRRRIERMGVGREVDLRLLRNGEPVDVAVVLDEAPKTAWTAEEQEDEDLGLTVREITMDDILAQNLEAGVQGVVVSELERAGWAQISGLQVGDIIRSIDRRAVDDLPSYRAVADELREDRPEAVLLFVQRQAETLFLRLRTFWPKRD